MLVITRITIMLIMMATLSACNNMANFTYLSSAKSPTVNKAKVNAQLGIVYLERHHYPEAKAKLELALKQAPGIPETWYSMAYYLEKTGNKAKAGEYYRKAIELAPGNGEAQNNYGTYLCRQGEYRASIDHFMQAVRDRRYQHPADAYENAGICALKIPDKTAAAEYFRLALAKDPKRLIAKHKLAAMNNHDFVAEASPEVVPLEITMPVVTAKKVHQPNHHAAMKPHVIKPIARVHHQATKKAHGHTQKIQQIAKKHKEIQRPKKTMSEAKHHRAAKKAIKTG